MAKIKFSVIFEDYYATIFHLSDKFGLDLALYKCETTNLQTGETDFYISVFSL